VTVAGAAAQNSAAQNGEKKEGKIVHLFIITFSYTRTCILLYFCFLFTIV